MIVCLTLFVLHDVAKLARTATIMPSSNVLPHALQTPAIKKLTGKRIILASASPRRKDILSVFVLRSVASFSTSTNGCFQGIAPEIIPSTFEENLPVSSFQNIHEYPVATATHKAIEVYERLVVSASVTTAAQFTRFAGNRPGKCPGLGNRR